MPARQKCSRRWFLFLLTLLGSQTACGLAARGRTEKSSPSSEVGNGRSSAGINSWRGSPPKPPHLLNSGTSFHAKAQVRPILDV